jgi:hypothetical protein
MNSQEELVGCLLHLTHVLASNHKLRLSIVRADEQPPVVSRRPIAVQCASGGSCSTKRRTDLLSKRSWANDFAFLPSLWRLQRAAARYANLRADFAPEETAELPRYLGRFRSSETPTAFSD